MRLRVGVPAAILFLLIGPSEPSRAGLEIGLDPGLGIGISQKDSDLSLQSPLLARTNLVVREGKEMDGSFELSAGPFVGTGKPRYVLGLTLNSERKMNDSGCMGPECYLLLRAGGMYEISEPHRFGLTGGMPFRFWMSRQWSARLAVSFTWLFKNSRGSGLALLYVTFGPGFLPEGKGE